MWGRVQGQKIDTGVLKASIQVPKEDEHVANREKRKREPKIKRRRRCHRQVNGFGSVSGGLQLAQVVKSS